jgi:hypothetical protein
MNHRWAVRFLIFSQSQADAPRRPDRGRPPHGRNPSQAKFEPNESLQSSTSANWLSVRSDLHQICARAKIARRLTRWEDQGGDVVEGADAIAAPAPVRRRRVLSCPNDAYLNLWPGFAVEPAAKPDSACYSIFRDHLFTKRGWWRRGKIRWVFGFAAHVVQRPRERIRVALVLRATCRRQRSWRP